MSVIGHARGAALRLSRAALALAQPHGWTALRAGVEPARLLRYREIEAFHGLGIRTILYVGANRGQELPLLLNAFPAAHVHCFEPSPPVYDELVRGWGSSPRCTMWPLALGSQTGEAFLHVSDSHNESSSLRTPSGRLADVFPGVTGWSDTAVAVSTLDEWSEGKELPPDVLLKMDVQGAEDLVLQGGADQLADVAAVIAEAAVTTTYEGAPDAETLLRLLTALGFRLCGHYDAVRSPVTNEIVEYDALFVRVAKIRSDDTAVERVADVADIGADERDAGGHRLDRH